MTDKPAPDAQVAKESDTSEVKDTHKFVSIPEHPKGLEVYDMENWLSVLIPGTTKFRITLAVLVGFIGMIVSIFLGLALGHDTASSNRYSGNTGNGFDLIMVGIYTAVFLMITWGICFAIYRKNLSVRVKDGAVEVDGKKYDPKHFGGLRYIYDFDYSVSKDSAPMLFGGIGIQYGRWGIVTPILVDKSMVGQYIVCTNEVINEYLAEPLPEYAPSVGIRKQVF
jgi:hypothetical protein